VLLVVILFFFRFVPLFCRDYFLRMLLVQVSLDGVEDAVDELRRLVGGEAPGDFERFVDGDGARRRLVQELVDGQPQDIAIDDGHTRDAPVLCARAYALVQLRKVRERSRSQPRRKLARRRLRILVTQLRPVRAHKLVRTGFGNISRKEHLQGALTRLTSRPHITPVMSDE
jgi:hypothetical protein